VLAKGRLQFEEADVLQVLMQILERIDQEPAQ